MLVNWEIGKMDKRCGILLVSVTIFVLCLVGTASATNWSVDDSGGEDFTGIQDAINNASDGDMILVYSGVYYENVVVNKSVTLKGIGHPRVRGSRIIRSAITLTADGITLVGFNATNSGSLWSDVGIKVTSNNNTITGNVFVNDGLSLYSSYQNTVEDNTVNGKPLVYLEDVSDYKVEDAGQVILVNCTNITVENLDLSNTSVGVELLKTRNSRISNNTVCNNNFVGISLYDSSNNNTFTGNNVSSNGVGIYLSSSSSNTITGNTARNNFVGIHLNESCNNIITGNNASNNWGGICLSSSSNNNTITGNNVSNNNDEGIRLSSSSNNNTITGNNVSSNGVGIRLFSPSNNNTITGNNVSNNNDEGIRLSSSSNNNTLTGNNVSSNGVGIRLFAPSNNNTITGNTFVNDGLSVFSSYQNTVEDNTVNGKPLVYLKDVSNYKVENAGQVIIVNCNNITIENLDLSNTSGGIALWKTENSKISNNTVCNNNWGGIYLSSSSNNSITGNNVSSNNKGIRLSSSSNNTIIGNNVSNNNWGGISLSSSSNNTITGNNVSNNRDGISISSSSNNTITGNNVNNNNEEGISLYTSSNNNTITGNVFVNKGLSVFSSYQNTVKDNKVNGKPLVYLEDVSDCKVENAGQVILINCSNISVENLDLSNTSIGVELLKTRNSRISNNTVCNNWNGIHLYYSNYNNNITGNNLRNNRYGIYLGHSSNNKIYFNNFIHNTYNVKSRGSTNIWNSPLEITYTYDGTTYKSYLGNYWDDYEGTDAEGDGIGNTHYSIDSKSDESDDYPLMKPFEDY